ncbi:radical SAM protein [Mariniphaga sediminis]|uniref:radical SAM protein n=1 Tax=Mariniphaga sediminis TaxID=1628158 RepID=UPI0035638CF3
MEAFDNYLNNLVNRHKENFSDYSNIRWLNPYQAPKVQETRDRLTKNLAGNMLFKETKFYHHQLSKGCKLCGLGTWSCLFITNKCNADCFYCPSSQKNDEVPATQSLTFENAESYAGYINFFGFKGVSFSGGEPLLFFDRTLHYLKTIRKMCAPDIYTWMYTNGILADSKKFRKLAAAGLNEVRFDIGATGYRLEKVKTAKGIVPHITIEIPAVPEEKEKLKQLLPQMIEAGVTNLNLHQLRLTKHNATKMLQRNYTFIPAEQPVVMESELAALEILHFAHEKKLEIGINYCSFFFKNRFQQAGFRKQLGKALATPGAVITEKGFIRELTENTIGYKALVISENGSTGTHCTELQLPQKTCYVKSETAMKPQTVDADTKARLEILLKNEPAKIPEDEFLFRIWQMEYIEKGLREY